MEEGLEEILESSCGLDVHKDKIEACILKTGAKSAYRETFGCIPSELDRLCKWINDYGCKDIAMESTGVYWLPIYERIEAKCPERQSLLVVNAYEIKNMPGRKTDIKDAHWIALLLKRGWLRQHNSFIPEHIVRSMREVSRLRRKITGDRSKASNQLEKFLQTHGFKFSSVFSSITGMSSTALLKRLAQRGKVSLRDIYDCCHKNLRHVPEEILAAVNGELNEAERKLLCFHIKRIEALSDEIRELTGMLADLFEEYKEQLKIAVSLPGINLDSAMEVLAEISPEPQASFDTQRKISKWAGLSPRNDDSADKITCRKTLHGNPYVKSILVQCAWAAVKTRNSEFQKWFWPRQCRLGRKKAIIAVARKLLCLLYTLLSKGVLYSPPVPAPAAV
jgi:transposase